MRLAIPFRRTVRAGSALGLGAALLLGAPGLAGEATPPAGGLNNGQGEKIENIEQLDLASLLGTVSSVSRKTESVLKAPAAVTTLSAEEIHRSGATMLPDVLRIVPGLQVYRTAAGNYVVSLRGTNGLSSNNVVVLVDGVEINSPIDFSVDWSAVPISIDDIERVEVVRGPVSTIYGANAYSGVVSIVTTGKDGETLGNRVRAYGGGDQRISSLAGLSGRYVGAGEHTAWQIAANASYDGTFKDTPVATVHTPPLRQGGLLARLQVDSGAHGKWVFEGSASVDQKSSLDHLVMESNPLTNTTAFGTVRYELSNLGGALEGATFWGRGGYLRQNTDLTLYRGLSYAGASGTRAEAGADFNFKLPAHLSAGLGGNAGITRVDAPFVNPAANTKVRPGYGFYGSLSYDPTEQLSFTAAARGDVSDMTGKLQGSYRVSAIYALPSASFRVTGSSAYRSPTWVEVAGRFVDPRTDLIFLEGSPTLKSPQVDSIEAAAILEPFSKFTVTPTVYVERLANLLIEDFAPVVRKSFINDPNTETVLGGELETRYTFGPQLSLLGTAGVLHWLKTSTPDETVGVPSENSTLTFGLRGQGSVLEGRLGYGLGVSFASDRSFSVRAGIPPQVLLSSLPNQVHLDANVSYRLGTLPWNVFLKAQTYVPGDDREAPLALASDLGSTVWAGLEYRP